MGRRRLRECWCRESKDGHDQQDGAWPSVSRQVIAASRPAFSQHSRI